MEGPETLRPPEEEKALKEQENHISKDDWWKIFMKVGEDIMAVRLLVIVIDSMHY